jgi:hypothetical protein
MPENMLPAPFGEQTRTNRRESKWLTGRPNDVGRALDGKQSSCLQYAVTFPQRTFLVVDVSKNLVSGNYSVKYFRIERQSVRIGNSDRDLPGASNSQHRGAYVNPYCPWQVHCEAPRAAADIENSVGAIDARQDDALHHSDPAAHHGRAETSIFVAVTVVQGFGVAPPNMLPLVHCCPDRAWEESEGCTTALGRGNRRIVLWRAITEVDHCPPSRNQPFTGALRNQENACAVLAKRDPATREPRTSHDAIAACQSDPSVASIPAMHEIGDKGNLE